MPTIHDWSTSAASNANADSDINFAEGQAPSTVNDAARVVMKRVKDFVTDIGGGLSSAGTANAITVTAGSSITAYANGHVLAFIASNTNTGATTLSVNSIGAKAVMKATGSGAAALNGAEIQSGCIYSVQYNTSLNSGAGAWLLINPTVNGVETGMIFDYAGSSAPTGFLLCYGQSVSRTTYAALFAVLSTTYGAVDGSTFNLPDLRGRVVAGKDNMGGTSANRLTDQTDGLDGDTLGDTGGSETHTLTGAQMPSHTHTGTTASGGSHSHNLGSTYSFTTNPYSNTGMTDDNGVQRGMTPGSDITTSTASAHTHTFTTASAGSSAAHNNVQPTIILNKIIKI